MDIEIKKTVDEKQFEFIGNQSITKLKYSITSFQEMRNLCHSLKNDGCLPSFKGSY